MRNILFFSIIFISSFCFSQELYQVKTITNYPKLLEDLDKDSANVIYSLNKPELDNIIKQSNKKYTLIYNFSIWCGYCVVKLPEALKIRNEWKENVQFLLLTKEKNKSAYLTNTHYDFVEKYNVNYPTFNISDEYAKGARKRYGYFLKLLDPNYEVEGMGVMILIRNEDQKILFMSNSRDEYEVNIEKVKSFIN